MILYSDKRFITNSEHPDEDWSGDADFVIPDSSELADKIIRLYPNFEFVFDDDGNISDVTETESISAETVATPTDHERIEAMEDAIMEIVSIITGVM